MSAPLRGLLVRLRLAEPDRRPCAHLIVVARTPLPAGRRDGDELAEWAQQVAVALRAAPEVREVFVRGHGGTRRTLHAAVLTPTGAGAAEHLRRRIEAVSGDLGVLPAVPRLDVYTQHPVR